MESRRAGACLLGKMKRFMSPKCHALMLDEGEFGINSRSTVLLNVCVDVKCRSIEAFHPSLSLLVKPFVSVVDLSTFAVPLLSQLSPSMQVEYDTPLVFTRFESLCTVALSLLV